jgi:hypothetical protein
MEQKELTKVVVLPAEFQEEVSNTSLDKTEAQMIASNYVPFMNDLQVQMEKLNDLKKNDPQNIQGFGDIRRSLGKLKSAVDKQKDKDKELIKIKGNLIQGLRNTVYNSAVLTQEEAKEYEERVERLEAEKVRLLGEDRKARLAPFVDDISLVDIEFGKMEEEIFEAYLAKKQSDFHDLLEAQKEAERLKAEQERLAALHNERKELLLDYWSFASDDIKGSNLGAIEQAEFDEILNGLKDLAKESEKKRLEVEEENKRLLALQQEQQKLQTKVRNRVARFEDAGWNGEVVTDREGGTVLADLKFLETASEQDLDKKLVAWEKVLSDRAETKKKAEEVRQKELAEIAEKQRQISIAEAEAKKKKLEEEAKAKAPDKDKLSTLSKDLLNYNLPEVNSKEAKALVENVKGLLLKVSNYLEENIKTM